jgi:hypothetical protein
VLSTVVHVCKISDGSRAAIDHLETSSKLTIEDIFRSEKLAHEITRSHIF